MALPAAPREKMSKNEFPAKAASSSGGGGGWEVICMGLREIGAQICPLILLAQMPISAEQPLGYLKLGEIINPTSSMPSFSEPL